MRLLPMGPLALIVEEPGADPALFARAVRALHPGIVDVVPAARTVLVTCESAAALDRVRELLAAMRVDGARLPVPESVRIPVVYDGTDLGELAHLIGRSPDEVATLHASADYEVAFCGFAPGFAYLRGLPHELHVPRRTTPRTSVPAGAVAVAAEYSAVYPTSSPGGWHLLGTTSMTMFDVDRDPPALLTPGTQVRFDPT